jgi:hypothetical protein
LQWKNPKSKKKLKKLQLKKGKKKLEFEDVNFGIQIKSTNDVLDWCKNDSAPTSRLGWVGPEQSKKRLRYLCYGTLTVTSTGTSQPGGLQRDVVYFGWPIAPSDMNPNAAGGGGGWRVAGSQPMSTAVNMEPK